MGLQRLSKHAGLTLSSKDLVTVHRKIVPLWACPSAAIADQQLPQHAIGWSSRRSLVHVVTLVSRCLGQTLRTGSLQQPIL